MSDYTKRAEELREDLRSIDPPLPDEYLSAYRDTVDNYMRLRNDCLTALVKLVEDESESHTDNAGAWRNLCEAMSSQIESSFRSQVDLVSKADGQLDLPALGGKAVKAVGEEKNFFARLAEANAARYRDQLVANGQDLRKFTEDLSEIWEQILGQVEGAHEEERKSYEEIAEITRKAIDQLAEADRTGKEKAEKTGAKILSWANTIAKLGGAAAGALGINIPDILGPVVETGTEWGSAWLDLWAETNPLLLARIANYNSVLAGEKGGLLPVFKQCRERVYSYWNEKGTKTSSVWPDQARSVLDDWKSHCATSEQGEDADRFSSDVYSKIKDRWECVKDVAEDFEKKWSGIFYGPLEPTTQDKLTDAVWWKQSTDNLVNLQVPDVGSAFLKNCDEIYGASLTEPLEQLESAAENLPDEEKDQMKEAVAQIKDKVQSQIAQRLAELHKRVGETIEWFRPDSIRATFDRSDVEKLVL